MLDRHATQNNLHEHFAFSCLFPKRLFHDVYENNGIIWTTEELLLYTGANKSRDVYRFFFVI